MAARLTQTGRPNASAYENRLRTPQKQQTYRTVTSDVRAHRDGFRNPEPLGTLGCMLSLRLGEPDMPPRASFLLSTSSDERTAILQGLLIGAVVIAGLYFGREVLLPLALAILLSFVLTPPLLLLRRIKLPRVVAVSIVVGAAFAIILALGWAISREVTQLAADLPSYRLTLSEKIKSFRESMARSPTLERAGEVLSELQKELANPEAEAPAKPTVGAEAERPEDQPLRVEIQEREPTGLELYERIAGTVITAARHRWHRPPLRGVHSVPARGSARPSDQTFRGIRSKARYHHAE